MTDDAGRGNDGSAKARVGRLVVFEGPNEVGKTTLAHALTAELKRQGIPCETHAFPGRSPGTLGHHVYQLHHNSAQFGVRDFTPAALQALHIAAHLDAIEGIILPRLAAGIDVVLDRYWWSTIAYGAAGGVSERILESLVVSELLAWGDHKPALVVVLDRSPAPGAKPDLVDVLRDQYRKLVDDASGNHPTCYVDNNGTVDQTVMQVAALLARFDPSKGDVN